MRDFDRSARTFVRGEGTALTDGNGHRVFDAVSSVWTILHGHSHPRIVEAIARQAATLDHATTLGASNPVAEELAERLCALSCMDYAFFASDGASAVEAALKMALQYWRNTGKPRRRRFVHLVGSYHGDTIGAMSVSDVSIFKAPFESVTFETRAYGDPNALGEDVAAIIVEPLVQAAAGMQMIEPSRYAGLREIEPLLIVDEIATGFGRTGTLFAFEQLGLHPDILCLGKAITGGALALSATLATERMYNVFLGELTECKHFYHGHSYAGNPIACAAALASLDLFEEEQTLERARMLASRAAVAARQLRRHPLVRDVRQCGTMMGIELATEHIGTCASATPAWRIADELYTHGHFTRPLGDVIQFVPPLVTSDAEADAFFQTFNEVLRT